MARAPLKFYRLWCGRKRHSGWIADKAELVRIGLRKGLIYGNEQRAGLGPLTRIEVGERKYARSRTVTTS